MAVVVYVGHARPDGAVRLVPGRSSAPRHACRLRDVLERALRLPEQPVGVAVHVAGDDVEVAVLVVVEPHGADRPPRIGESDRCRHIAERLAIVLKQRVRPIAKRHEEIEIGVAVVVHPHRLTHRTGWNFEPRLGGRVAERPLGVAIQAQDRRARAGREADQQVGVAVGVGIAPGRGPRRTSVRDSRGRRGVGERPTVVAIETVGRSVEADEQIEVGVAVVRRPRR